jgi:hypothetical protein
MNQKSWKLKEINDLVWSWTELILQAQDYMTSTACSVGWWLMAGAGLFWEKSTAGWLRLVAGGWFVLREKYCWLVADKPSEQGARFHQDKTKLAASIKRT